MTDKPLRLTRYNPNKPHRKMSKAQEAAQRRTWRIIQLRSQWVLSWQVRTTWRRALVRWLIDDELRSMGAEPHGKRIKRQEAEREAEDRRDYELPF